MWVSKCRVHQTCHGHKVVPNGSKWYSRQYEVKLETLPNPFWYSIRFSPSFTFKLSFLHQFCMYWWLQHNTYTVISIYSSFMFLGVRGWFSRSNSVRTAKGAQSRITLPVEQNTFQNLSPVTADFAQSVPVCHTYGTYIVKKHNIKKPQIWWHFDHVDTPCWLNSHIWDTCLYH
jgi:hypothetical protein